jgi:hypothetical protein
MKLRLDDYGFLVRATPDFHGSYTEIKGKQEKNYRIVVKLQPIGFDGFKNDYTINLTHQILFASYKDAQVIVQDILSKKEIDLAFWWWSARKATKRIDNLNRTFKPNQLRSNFSMFVQLPKCRLSDHPQQVIEATVEDEDDGPW